MHLCYPQNHNPLLLSWENMHLEVLSLQIWKLVLLFIDLFYFLFWLLIVMWTTYFFCIIFLDFFFQAANYLNIQSLLELTCQTVADMMKGKSVEYIRKTFNITNDYTPEEEEEIRREFPWVFEWETEGYIWKDLNDAVYEIRFGFMELTLSTGVL